MRSLATALALTTLLPLSAAAQDFESVSDAPHDSFYLRGGVGFGLALLLNDQREASATTFALPIELVAGYSVIPNLAVNLDVQLTPVLAGGGTAGSGASEADIEGVNGFAWYVGAGVTYYIMPANVYLGGSIGFGAGSSTFEVGPFEIEADSDVGFGLKVTAGKQWLVAERVGVGFGGIFQFMTLPPDVGDADNTSVLLFGVVGNVSYN